MKTHLLLALWVSLFAACLAVKDFMGANKDATVTGSNERNSALQLIDSAFDQEAYLNRQISNSLRASQQFFSDPSLPVSSQIPAVSSASELQTSAESELESVSQQFDSNSNGIPGGMEYPKLPAVTLLKPPGVAAVPQGLPATTGESKRFNVGPSVNFIGNRLSRSGTDKDIKSLRPNAGKDEPDVVSFGIFAKKFFHADLEKNKFTADAVMALKWKDPRVADLVPSGMDEISMSGKAALSKIWMPEVVVTNRVIKKIEIISTTVTLRKTGEVSKVERFGVMCNNIFDLTEYPFDTQKVQVKIASSKYMLEEVVMKPDEDASKSGASKDCAKGSPYALKGHKVFAFEEIDGALRKSRGVLELSLERKFEQYQENHLMPASMLLMISWGVFWFPFLPPFITPRLALSILALLSFTTLVLKSVGALPAGAPRNWNDTINQQIQLTMFITIVVNIFSEICFHQYKLQSFGKRINDEAKVLLPALSIVALVIIFTAGKHKWLSMDGAAAVTKTLYAVVMACYLGFNMLQLPNDYKKQAQEQQEKDAADKKKEEEQKLKKAEEEMLHRALMQHFASSKGITGAGPQA